MVDFMAKYKKLYNINKKNEMKEVKTDESDKEALRKTVMEQLLTDCLAKNNSKNNKTFSLVFDK